MKLINFVPPQIRQRKARQRMAVASVVAILLGSGAAIALWMPIRAEVANGKQRLDASRTALTALSANSVPDVHSQAVQKEAGDRIAILNTLAKTEINWPRAIRQVSDSLPKRVYLTSLAVAQVQGVVTVTLGGTAASNYDYAVFVESFKTVPFLKSAKESGFAYSAQSGTVTFTVTVPVRLSDIDYSAT